MGFFSSKLEFLGGDSPCLTPSNLEVAVSWYKEKLDCRELTREEKETLRSDESSVTILALPGPYLTGVYFYPDPSGNPTTVPVLYVGDLAKAHRLLSERGVACTPIQSDASGHSYFELRDLDGNVIEICHED